MDLVADVRVEVELGVGGIVDARRGEKATAESFPFVAPKTVDVRETTAVSNVEYRSDGRAGMTPRTLECHLFPTSMRPEGG